jgi:hypothetical protein
MVFLMALSSSLLALAWTAPWPELHQPGKHFPLDSFSASPITPRRLTTSRLQNAEAFEDEAVTHSHLGQESKGTRRNLSFWIARARASGNQTFTNKMFFLHFSKAGGTSLCTMAKHNMAHGPNPKNNCNLPPQYRSLWQGTADVQKNIPSKFAQWGFLANEGPMADEPVFDPDFFHVTLLREPVSRAKSGYFHTFTALRAKAKRSEGTPNLTFSKWLSDRSDSVSNYYVRRLAGVSTMTLGHLTDHHYRIAQERLDHFDLVWLTEWYFMLGPIMRALFGWEHQLGVHKHLRPAEQDRTQDPFAIESNLELAHQKSRLDTRLYRHAVRLASEALAQLISGFHDFCRNFVQNDGLAKIVSSSVPLSQDDQLKIESALNKSCS